jgi:hypothetical protein
MGNLNFSRYALYISAAAALLAGCGGSQPPIGAPGAMRTLTIATQGGRGKSWMLPDAKSSDLLYVATGDNVYVLSYPQGKLVGSLGIVGNNLCSDSKGDVFIPSGGYTIFEYSHGAIGPIRKLADGDIPLGCAVDPITGNLAVTNEASGCGEVAIYPNAQEPALWYRDAAICMFGLDGYDQHGNLFADGTGSANVLAELPSGSTTFTNFALDHRFDAYDSVQWDGKYITLSNPTTLAIYRLQFGASSFKVIGTTHVHHWQSAYNGRWPYTQTWLQGGSFIAQSSNLAELGLWRYPKGGNANKVIGPFKSGDVNIYGVTISLAPH